MDEFSLIDQYFKSLSHQRNDVILGIGDDAACVKVPAGMNLLVSTDTLVSEVHFLPEWDSYDIAYKAVMVNVSDMAAMAAQPCWITLALTLPELNQSWLKSFSKGLNDALKQFNIDLIGGDTTHGPLSITITILGLSPFNQTIQRNGAKPADIILVSGQLGAAALAVNFLNNKTLPAEDKVELMEQLVHPKPRIDLIKLLRSHATSAIDISDGLSADLNHICVSSNVGACLNKEAIPVHPLVSKYLGEKAIEFALGGGDDYELCFTVSPQNLGLLMSEVNQSGLVCYPIGVIEEVPGLRLINRDGTSEVLQPKGYLHF